MLEHMMRTLIPIMLTQVGKVSRADKLHYADFLIALASAYRENRRADFSRMLLDMNLPAEWLPRIMESLWNEDQSKRQGSAGG